MAEADENVELTLDLNFDSDKLKEIIKAEITAQMQDILKEHSPETGGRRRRRKEPEEPEERKEPRQDLPLPPGKLPKGFDPIKPPQPEPGVIPPVQRTRRPEEDGRTITDSGTGLSEYGYGHEPKKAYPTRRRPKVELPETGYSPLRPPQEEPTSGPIFGTDAYAKLRGTQQSKVAYRGRVRRSAAVPPHEQETQVTAGISPLAYRFHERHLEWLEDQRYLREERERRRGRLDTLRK